MSSKEKWWLAIILTLALTWRLIKIDWGQGYYFHPDENNMARAVINLDQDQNPHFFAYGQLPLFLALFLLRSGQYCSGLINLNWSINFGSAILALRLVSILAGTVSVYLIYQIGKKLINTPGGLIAAAEGAFLPGLIQASHFGTTETLLTCWGLLILNLSLDLYQQKNKKYFFYIGIVLGLGLATKISAALFALAPIMATIGLIHQQKYSFFKGCLYLAATAMVAICLGLILSPFLVLDYQTSLTTLRYEVAVAKGNILTFYTRQFIKTFPWWFTIQKVFPFAVGIGGLITSLGGLILLGHRKNKSQFWPWLIVLVFFGGLFIYQGQLFTKWVRFMIPILPVFTLLSAQFIKKLPPLVGRICLLVCLLPGLIFIDLVYASDDVRNQFSSWVKENFSSSTTILSESGNVVNLPLGNNQQLKVINFDFYQLEEANNQKKLCQQLTQADYILIPSRRVFANLNDDLVATQSYYEKLFSDQLGFNFLISFAPQHHYWPLTSYYQKAESLAEETWTVFDQPTIRVYQKVCSYSAEEYCQILGY